MVRVWQAEVASDGKIDTAQFHTLITDHLGTPQIAVNDAGIVTWTAVSESFGKTTPDVANQITMNLRFPGQYYDEETGAHYNYFRDYNPNIGRYIQKDLIGLDGGINWYAYVEGKPINWLDNFGLWASAPYHDVHQRSIDAVLGRGGPRSVDGRDRAILREAQIIADRAEFQTTELSYRHAMRAPGQSVAEACRLANEFVRSQYETAWQALDQGRREDAFMALGIALHALQDSTSPGHINFQEWSGTLTKEHVWGDIAFKLPDSLLRITEDAWDWFASRKLPEGNLFPCECM